MHGNARLIVISELAFLAAFWRLGKRRGEEENKNFNNIFQPATPSFSIPHENTASLSMWVVERERPFASVCALKCVCVDVGKRSQATEHYEHRKGERERAGDWGDCKRAQASEWEEEKLKKKVIQNRRWQKAAQENERGEEKSKLLRHLFSSAKSCIKVEVEGLQI